MEAKVNKPEFLDNISHSVQESWNELPAQKRILFLVGGFVVVILIVFTVFNTINKRIEKQIDETDKYREALDCIAENQYVYQLNRAQKEAMRQRLLNADAKVVSKLTSMASNLGFDVTVTPKDPHKTSDDSGTEEQEIEVTLKNVDYAKVLEYLIEIHKLDTPIFMRHLNMSRTSALTSNDTKMTVSITLMSYRLKEQNAT